MVEKERGFVKNEREHHFASRHGTECGDDKVFDELYEFAGRLRERVDEKDRMLEEAKDVILQALGLCRLGSSRCGTEIKHKTCKTCVLSRPWFDDARKVLNKIESEKERESSNKSGVTDVLCKNESSCGDKICRKGRNFCARGVMEVYPNCPFAYFEKGVSAKV